ncbi:ycf3-interacting protein 1, chloroplastic [Momordica charantia]|uniref:Ycf3-interacting protein 1, chloroplastic n=1 Tax=Momordica charantia TaxID=3673 RepID=A0A6J1CZ78_MOMCH|nr:ycf3-interacting protein 1, chloroplastic [Momordica charantia]
MQVMALQLRHFPLSSSSSSSSSSSIERNCKAPRFRHLPLPSYAPHQHLHLPSTRNPRIVACVGKEDTQLRQSSSTDQHPDAQDLEYVRQIQRVLELLKKNRDMLFNEVKLTVMIEDPREVERRRLLGIDDDDAPTRDDLAATLEEVNEGKFPKNRVALRMLAEEMINWPNLEVEAPTKKERRSKSLYAKATDTGVDPLVAAKRLNIDWDSAAEIEDADLSEDPEVPAAVGYGALYMVTAFPVIIGISVVLILFYNSLQ